MVDTQSLVHYLETPSTRDVQKIARSTFTDAFLPMLLNHWGAFYGPGVY